MSAPSLEPGMLVVCIKKRSNPGYVTRVGSNEIVGLAQNPIFPQYGGIYTIRHVNPIRDDILLLFNEIDNSHLKEFVCGGLEPGFSYRHFRPLGKDRLAIFRQHLTTIPSKTKEPA